MQTLNNKELTDVAGGSEELGYAVGYSVTKALVYTVGGGLGRDFGSWLYDKLN